MGLYQSYQQVFVTNAPALLAEGKTVDALAVGQIGFLDAKTYKAVTAPTYAKNKALFAVWGTPDVNVGEFGGVPNENEYSKLIKGKLVKKIRSKKAQRGQTPIYTIGWSGDVSDTDTLTANVGESKDLFVKLSGTVIDRIYSKQGIIKQFKTTPDCLTDCAEACSTVYSPDLANELVAQMRADKDFKKLNVRVKALIENYAPTETTCYKFILNVCDTGDARALGIVQAQYGNDKVTFLGNVDAISSYEIVRDANTTPAAFTSQPVFVPDCTSCPSGYTYTASAKIFHVRTANGVTSGNIASAFTGETAITTVNTDPQFITYAVAFPTSTDTATVLADATTAGYIATFIGIENNICTLTSAVSVAWAANGTLKKQTKDYRLTIADSVCGTNRLADLQAAFPALTISVVDSGGSCVHTYQTTVTSSCYEVGCGISEVIFTKPEIFEGVEWVEVPVVVDKSIPLRAGIQIETPFVNRITNDCTFDAFPYENDIIHVQVSNYNPDFNASPCEDFWPFKTVRQVKFPMGHGQYVRKMEQESKQYDQRFRSSDPVVRENEGYSLQADPTKFYDQYVIEFETQWLTSGWSEKMTQSIHLAFFVPEGTGGQIESALNSYATSAGLEEDGTVI